MARIVLLLLFFFSQQSCYHSNVAQDTSKGNNLYIHELECMYLKDCNYHTKMDNLYLPPFQALVHQYTQLAEQAASDAQRFRETKVAEMDAELNRLKADKKRRDDQRKAKMEQEVA